MPLQATSGAASYDAFGGGVAVAPKYIEDFFQTWLRTGTGASATVTTGLNASINKSLVWTKSRSAATNHKLTDTVRGATKALSSNTTSAEATDSQGLTAFSSTGYTIGTNTDYNNSGATYVDWQWLATPKFFDVVTYTGNGTTQNIAHSLGAVPGCIIVTRTDAVQTWPVYHRSLATNERLILETTAATDTSSTTWNNTAPTSTVFTVGGNAASNASGGTYVAYIFAHNAGGFGLTGTDNVISCGSFTTDGSKNATVNLGYEPQFVLIKTTGVSGSWLMTDTMRGMPDTSGVYAATLSPNSPSAENTAGQDSVVPIATGFKTNAPTMQASQTYIYIAIRRGPMKVPTDGTKVFAPVARTGTGSVTSVTTPGFPVDMVMIDNRLGYRTLFFDKLRGANHYITSVNTSAETTYPGNNGVQGFLNTGFILGADTEGYVNFSGDAYINWCFGRAPGFFDEVCYTGNGPGTQVISHNLAVAPELSIFKARSGTGGWTVYNGATQFLRLNETAAGATDGNISPTVTSVTVSSSLGFGFNASGVTYVAYLFASCPGVSKCGSYTGTGTTQQINCGFTGGARFVLIKRTDSTGDWVLWDSSRGMVAGTDPRLALNSTAAEVNQNWVYATTGGFEIVTSDAAVNASGGSYIFLSVA